jgi:hypothetical protein
MARALLIADRRPGNLRVVDADHEERLWKFSL